MDVAPWSTPTKYNTSRARKTVPVSHSAALAADRSAAVALLLGTSEEVMAIPFRDVASQFQR
jgi:hypothetical protein